MNNGQLSQEYNLVSKPSSTVARGRMNLDDTFEVTGSLTTRYEKKAHAYPLLVSKYFGNIPYMLENVHRPTNLPINLYTF
jgi:hypothetical protein